ncbi:MmcB family DNA repair protein [Hyphomicrobium sp.]|uniref:MmcB family DNA repair protein n=1 Tax=Hyphomicrobium sp. TaxID=82 RepID=UPI000FB48673|nr:MmcB family DNA repair protein [Hyphomicrobium sp.]RUO98386.1 MAG: DNA repair protein MmcB-related protein [Hyphomicrobium sp.]
MTDGSPSSTKPFDLVPIADKARDYERAKTILRGTQRLLRTLDFESLSEVTLASGRRADVLALRRNGEIWIVEIKSSVADFRADLKWPEYREFCDALLFAVAPDFPSEILPTDAGLILADAYGGELVRPPPVQTLAPARRKALTLSIARTASMRLLAQIDPSVTLGEV